MSVLLINAPYPRHAKFFGQPTSLLYAASLLSKWRDELDRFPLRMVNFNNWGLNEYSARGQDYLKKQINELDPRIVAISATSAAWSESRRLAETAKSVGVPFVVLGGPHEDDVPTPTSVIDENIDICVSGDGESPLLHIAKFVITNTDATSNSLEPLTTLLSSVTPVYGECKVHLKSGDSIHMGGGRCEMLAFDELPMMPRHLLSRNDRYHFPIFHDSDLIRLPTTEVMTQRGCIAKCDFCSESERLRLRSVDSVVEELNEIRRLGFEAVFFDDSTFTNRSRSRRIFVNELCAAMEGMGIRWGCQTRVDSLDESLCHDLKRGGCDYIYFGIESVNESFLRSLGKTYRIDRVTETLSLCHSMDIRVGTSLILGTPDTDHCSRETEATARQTFEFIRHHVDNGPIVLASINLFGYYPNTPATLSLQSRHPEVVTTNTWKQPPLGDTYPFSLLEEFPSLMPFGLLESAPGLLTMADEIIGDVIIGQDFYSRETRAPTPPG